MIEIDDQLLKRIGIINYIIMIKDNAKKNIIELYISVQCLYMYEEGNEGIN